MNITASHRPLAGRHALVSGASRGIGAAVARELNALGARLTLLGRDAEALAHVAAGLDDAVVATADVGDVASVEAAVSAAREAAGPIAILVNNAGIGPSAPFLKTSAEVWSGVMRTNLDGTVNLCRAALPDMLTLGWGRIVNIASTAGLRGYPYVTAYCSSKHAVVGLTKSSALDHATQGIRINGVAPGAIKTDIIAAQLGGGDTNYNEASISAMHPMNRLGRPEEVAKAAIFLLSDDASFITGANIPVDGGFSAAQVISF